ncbi:MAG: Rab family GTPase [Candidatus Thorarchaeota archaeon]
MSKPEYVYKICIVGDAAVGKTSTILRWSEGFFRKEYQSTMGVQHYSRIVDVGDEPTCVKMMIWDLAGQDIFKHLRSTFYQGAKGLVIMFDVTRQETFGTVPKWIKEAVGFIGENVPYILAGNKTDLVPGETQFFGAAEYAQTLNIPFIKTSAKTGSNIEDLFMSIGNIVHNASMEEVRKDKTWIG